MNKNKYIDNKKYQYKYKIIILKIINNNNKK